MELKEITDLIAAQGKDSKLKMAVGAEIKGWVSIGFYTVGILSALVWTQWVALGCYAFVIYVLFSQRAAFRGTRQG